MTVSKKIIFQLVTIVFAIGLLYSCGNDGYIEVRNRTQYEMTNVNWGGYLEFGVILLDEKKGIETELTGEEYINFKMNEKNYRSLNKITIDARTSATFIVKDTTNIVQQ